MIVSSNRRNIFDYVQFSILVFVIEYFIIYSKHYIIAIILLILFTIIFIKTYYIITLFKDFFEIKYLFQIKKRELSEIDYIEIRRPFKSVFLEIYIKTKNNKGNFCFGYKDEIHLLEILNYFKCRNIKIKDENERLERIFKIENDRYIEKK
jgi:hypothetical protein